MKVAIDISPVQDPGHSVRGVGSYITSLKKALAEIVTPFSLQFFSKQDEIDLQTDLVHYPYFDPFRVQKREKSTKMVITVHDLTPFILRKSFPIGIRGIVAWQRNKRILRGIDAIITDSESSKKDIVRLVGIPDKKVHVAYLAAGAEFKKLEIGNWKLEITKRYNLPDRFALYVGDVTANKNLPRLVTAIRKTDIPLVMVGKALVQSDFDKTHPWNKDLVQVQKMVRGNKQFILPGFVPTEELVALYNAATVFVMPSLYEGFGLPILEAMQCGCPVITAKNSSLQEVAGEAALFVDPENTDDIASKLEILFTDKNLQEKYMLLGQKQAAKFSWQKTAKATLAVYEKVLSGKT